jgi:hypothetical protein
VGEKTVALALLASFATACGGQVRTGDPEPSPTTEPAPQGGAANGTSGDPGDTVALPECKLGFAIEESAGRACVYVASGRCYEKKLDACGCACKKASGTLCLNGFPESDGTTIVTCH